MSVTRLREVLDRIGRPSVVSWPAFVITFVAGVFGNLVAGDPGVMLGQRLVILAAAQAALWLPLLLLRAILLRDPARSRPVLVLIGVAVAIVARTACVAGLSASVVDPELSRFAYRLVGNIANQGVIILGTAYVLAIVRERRAQVAVLASLRAQLQESVDAVAAVMEARNEEAVERVRTVLVRELDQLDTASADDALASLQHTVTDVVRPLSHELAQTLPSATEEADQPEPRVGWTQTIGDVESGRPFLPFVTTALLGIEVIATVSTNARGVVIAPLVIVLVGILLAVANRVLPPILRDRETTARIAIVASATLVVAMLVSLAIWGQSLPTGIDDDSHDFLVTLAIVAVPYVFAFTLAVSICAAILRAQRLTVVELAASTDELRRTLVRRRQAQWLQQKALSRALHGPVQAAVTAAAIRLDASIREGEVAVSAVAGIRDELLASLDVLGSTSTLNDWRQGLTRIVGTWDGICAIDVQTSEEARRALDCDVALSSCVVDILTEVVSNAVRHGGATRLALTVALVDADRTLRLGLVGDGSSSATSVDGHAPGLGTRLLDDCTLLWSRDAVAGEQRFTATLPLD